jgi:AraC-like DNA-binding protein
VIDQRSLVSADGVSLYDVRCRHGRGRGIEEVHRGRSAVIFIRRGCFVRACDGVEATLDPTLAYCLSGDVEQRYDHPHAGGDDCTAIFFDDELAVALWGGDPQLPSHPLPTDPLLDIEHRRLLADARYGADELEIAERSVTLAASLLAGAEARRVDAGRPATEIARRRLADDVREALVSNYDLSLTDLSALLAVSPHHLSRSFRQMTGLTIARYRMRLRLRAALERLLGGERKLARIAKEVGFADQSHLCRVARAETSLEPAEIRRFLTAPVKHDLSR